MTDDPAAVDRGVLEELEKSVGDDRAFVRELIETYLEDAPRQIASIREGITDRDVERTNRAAHTLKSNSASVGALGLSAMCRELETLTSTATTGPDDLSEPAIDALVQALAFEFDEVRDELNALVPAEADNS